MSDIKISDLYPVGSEFFQDTESFLHELTDQEIAGVTGGGFVYTQVTVTVAYTPASNVYQNYDEFKKANPEAAAALEKLLKDLTGGISNHPLFTIHIGL